MCRVYALEALRSSLLGSSREGRGVAPGVVDHHKHAFRVLQLRSTPTSLPFDLIPAYEANNCCINPEKKMPWLDVGATYKCMSMEISQSTD